MLFMWAVSWISTILLLLCATLCIASGLFYIAEIVEEYPRPTKAFITYSIWAVIGLTCGMFAFENYPINVVGFGLFAHLVYMTLLRNFPFCDFTSMPFLGSVVVFCCHQYTVFQHFSRVWHPFSDVLAFFTICVWLVPFSFFVSLSANDTSLPTTSTEDFNSYRADAVQHGRKERAGVLSLLRWFSRKKDDFLPMQTAGKMM